MFSPLDQFEIIPLYFLNFSSIKNLFSNLDGACFLGFFLFAVCLFWFNREPVVISKFYTFGFSFFAQIVRNMLVSTLNLQAVWHMPLLSTFFIIILIFNLIGLILFGFCVIFQNNITQVLGCLVVIGLITFKNFSQLRLKFINGFISRNVYFLCLACLSLIAMISLFFRMYFWFVSKIRWSGLFKWHLKKKKNEKIYN